MEDILDEVAAFSLASHLLWTVWALKQVIYTLNMKVRTRKL